MDLLIELTGGLGIRGTATSRAHAQFVSDPWHQFYRSLDAREPSTASVPSEAMLPIGINGEKRRREEERRRAAAPPERRVRRRRAPIELTPEEQAMRKEAEQRYETIMAWLSLLPTEIAEHLLVEMFVPRLAATDFRNVDYPRLTLDKQDQEDWEVAQREREAEWAEKDADAREAAAEEEEDVPMSDVSLTDILEASTEEDVPMADISLEEAAALEDEEGVSLWHRPWRSISDTAYMFAMLAGVLRTAKELEQGKLQAEWAYLLNSSRFRREVWRRWLDGPGGGWGAGLCTGAELPRELLDDPALDGTIRWYTQGFLGSVVLHMALLNSARNAITAIGTVRELSRIEGGLAALEAVSPDWVDRWVRGDFVPKEALWKSLKAIEVTEDRTVYSLAWFAPDLCHGILYLDFVRPRDHITEYLVMGTVTGAYPAPALNLLRMIRGSSQGHWWGPSLEDPGSGVLVLREDGPPVPFVVRVPALTQGGVLASGQQLTWGWTGAMEGERLTRLRTPMPVGAFDPMAPHPLSSVGGMVISGVTAPDPYRPPPIGLAFADDRTVTVRGKSKISNTDNPNLGESWYSRWMDLWLADVRLDTPESAMILARRVGSRQRGAITKLSGWTQRGFRRRLGNELVTDEMARPATASTPHIARHRDGKTLIFSRCWMPRPTHAWLQGRTPQFYDESRDVWTLDVGEGTAYLNLLISTRCYRGPALPTSIPDLRMDHLIYSVPVYRNPEDGTEDVERVKRHGRIDRILLTPKVTFALDRVTLSASALTNAAWWVVSRTSPRGYVLPRRLRGAEEPRALVYDWDLWRPDPDDERWLSLMTPGAFRGPGEKTARTDLGSVNAMMRQVRTLVKNAQGTPQILPYVGISKTARERRERTKMLLELRSSGTSASFGDRIEWTNLLLGEGVALQDLVTALDTAMALQARLVSLSMHPTLKAANAGKDVNWRQAQFRTFDVMRSDRLAVRLGLPSIDGKFLQQYEPTEARPAGLRAAVTAAPTGVYLDFSHNRIAYLTQRQVRALTATYSTRGFGGADAAFARGQGLRIFLWGNPVTMMEQPPDSDPNLFIMKNPLVAAAAITSFERRSLELRRSRRLREYIDRGTDPNGTVGGGRQSRIEGLELVRAAGKGNPYGDDWTKEG